MPDGLRTARHFLWGTPSVKTYRFCQRLPLGGSLWRARKLCALAGSFAAMPKGPILEGAVERSETGGVQGATPSGAARQIPPFVTYGDIFPRSGGSRPSRGRLCAMPEALPPPLKAVPLGKVASPQAMTEGVTPPPRLRNKNSVENHRLCPFSTPGFSPWRFVENCPGQNSRLEKSKPVSRSKL